MIELVKTLVIPQLCADHSCLEISFNQTSLTIKCPHYEAFEQLEDNINLLAAGAVSCNSGIELIEIIYGESSHQIPIEEISKTEEFQEEIRMHRRNKMKEHNI